MKRALPLLLILAACSTAPTDPPAHTPVLPECIRNEQDTRSTAKRLTLNATIEVPTGNPRFFALETARGGTLQLRFERIPAYDTFKYRLFLDGSFVVFEGHQYNDEVVTRATGSHGLERPSDVLIEVSHVTTTPICDAYELTVTLGPP